MRTTLIVFYSAFIAIVALIVLTSSASKGDSSAKDIRTLCETIECILKRDAK